MKYYIDNSIDDVYSAPYKDNYAEALEVKNGNIAGCRLNTIKSGDVLEAEIFPYWLTKEPIASVKKKLKQRTYEEHRAAYEKRQRKYLRRVINKNFLAGHTWLTLTFDDKHLPATFEDAERLILNYIRRVRYKAKKVGIDLKYVYTIEMIKKDGRPTRVHYHVVINVTDRDYLEKAWKYGGRPHSRSLMPDNDGLDGMANYILRPSKNQKAYRSSLNLEKPTLTSADTKITRRCAAKMAGNYEYAVSKFAKLYPEYIFRDLEVTTSEYLSGFYIYAKFIKRDPSPPAAPIYILDENGRRKNTTRDLNTARTRRKPRPRTPKPLSKEQVRDRLIKLAGIDKEISRLYKDLTALPDNSPMYNAYENTLNARNKQFEWFNTVTANLSAVDKTLLEDKYIKNKRLIELTFKYNYAETSLSRKIGRLIDKITAMENTKKKKK